MARQDPDDSFFVAFRNCIQYHIRTETDFLTNANAQRFQQGFAQIPQHARDIFNHSNLLFGLFQIQTEHELRELLSNFEFTLQGEFICPGGCKNRENIEFSNRYLDYEPTNNNALILETHPLMNEVRPEIYCRFCKEFRIFTLNRAVRLISNQNEEIPYLLVKINIPLAWTEDLRYSFLNYDRLELIGRKWNLNAAIQLVKNDNNTYRYRSWFRGRTQGDWEYTDNEYTTINNTAFLPPRLANFCILFLKEMCSPGKVPSGRPPKRKLINETKDLGQNQPSTSKRSNLSTSERNIL